MLTRRKFLCSLGAIVAGIQLACHIKAVEVIEKVIPQKQWIEAQFEKIRVYSKDVKAFVKDSSYVDVMCPVDPVINEAFKSGITIFDVYPDRYDVDGMKICAF